MVKKMVKCEVCGKGDLDQGQDFCYGCGHIVCTDCCYDSEYDEFLASNNCECCPIYADTCGLVGLCETETCACLTCKDGSNKSESCELRWKAKP